MCIVEDNILNNISPQHLIALYLAINCNSEIIQNVDLTYFKIITVREM